MDLNPTFGHQELLETLSQHSGANSVSTSAAGGGGGGDNHSLRSNRSNNHNHHNHSGVGGGGGGPSSATANHHVNEAVRRLGYRLSVQAHGGDIRGGGGVLPASPSSAAAAAANNHEPQRAELRAHVRSGFVSLAALLAVNNNNNNNSSETATASCSGEESEDDAARSRTNKVAKTRYSDHGEHQHQHHHHHPKQPNNTSHSNFNPANSSRSPNNHEVSNNSSNNLWITRKLTVECKERFRQWEEVKRRSKAEQQHNQQQQQRHHPISPTHRFSLSQLALGGNNSSSLSSSQQQSQQLVPPPSLQEKEEDEDDAYDDAYDNNNSFSNSGLPASLMGSAGAGAASGSAVAARRRKHQHHHHHHHHPNIALGEASPGTRSGKSLLSAVLEAESNASATNTSTSDQQQQQRRQQQYLQHQQQQRNRGDVSTASQSISTKDSKTAASAGNVPPPPPPQQQQSEQQQQDKRNSHLESKAAPAAAPPPPPAPRGRCLTTPSEPFGNGGLDNAEGNLIVCENDSIVVARKNMRTIHNNSRDRHRARHHSATTTTNSSSNKSEPATAEFRIRGLQGQGTFAQVFECLHVQTDRLVAVKIIKNKPVYTRQAAIEIDIFQTLQQQQQQQPQSEQTTTATRHNNNTASAQSPSGNSSSNSNLDYMVNLDFYFMHQNHLCLVFELLGWNLYEVLKRRQFRGLPLTVVRDIVRQVLEGCRDLSQKNVVHCDLKPENILLLSPEANAAVVVAGDAASQSAASASTGTRSDRTATNLQPQQQQQHSASTTDSHATTVPTHNIEPSPSKVKIIDFGSACFEGYTAHTYIQSRFYRSPEVLMGLPYDSAIDLWSLGCVAAELFLGLPILPGVHEHDQLVRIAEMISTMPEWMVDQGSKSTKYYVKFVPQRPNSSSNQNDSNSNDMSRSDVIGTPFTGGGGGGSSSSTGLPLPQWRLKTQQEYIASLSQASIRKKGGMEKLHKQPGTRYFKQKRLSDILFLHAQHQCPLAEDRALIPAFVHFLYGILDPDPWKRWTAFQAAQHPFVTGHLDELRPRARGSNNNNSVGVGDPKEENQANLEFDMYWPSPWDPAICRRKLLNVQKMREKQQSLRRSSNLPRPNNNNSLLLDSSLSSAGHGREGGGGGGSSSTSMADPMFTDGSIAGGGGGSINNHPPPPPQQREASPPAQISSSGSTSHGGSTGYAAPPVNWQGHGQQQQQQQQQPAVAGAFAVNQQPHIAFANSQVISDSQSTVIPASNRPQYSGAQSLQGGMGFTPTGVDFAQALTRPGVIPGSFNGLGTSVASQSTTASFQFGNISQTFSHGGGQSVFMQDAATTNSGMPNNNVQGAPLFEQYLSAVPGQVQPEEPFRGMSSATSSVTMTEAASQAGDSKQLEFLAQQQRQQLAFLQQQQMMQQSFQQQQQQLALQQPMLASGPGGFYYVTTSSTGQPILLQPVGLLNQQGVGGQMFMNAPSGANQQQQQPMAFNEQAFAQQQGMNMNAQFGGGMPQYMNQGSSQQPQMHVQPQKQMHFQQPQQQQMQPQAPPQQQQQQRYFAPPPPREPYRHGRGGGTSY